MSLTFFQSAMCTLTAEREARFMSLQKTKKFTSKKEAEVVGSNNPTRSISSILVSYGIELSLV
jgi:hypothetical protein